MALVKGICQKGRVGSVIMTGVDMSKWRDCCVRYIELPVDINLPLAGLVI